MSSTPSIPSGGPSTPLNRIQLHSSVTSHLSTELSFLQTLLLRARDQHRSQLFLRRMYEVLRIFKSVLKYLKEPSSDDVSRWEKRKLRGEQLIHRAIRILFTAQRFTSQIIELHHFLPLQTTVISIYSRLFTISMNIANVLGMDLERLILSGGSMSKSRTQTKELKGSVLESGENGETTGSKDVISKDDMMILDDIGGGYELGEKIERISTSSTPKPAAQARKSSQSERSKIISFTSSPQPTRPPTRTPKASPILQSTPINSLRITSTSPDPDEVDEQRISSPRRPESDSGVVAPAPDNIYQSSSKGSAIPSDTLLVSELNKKKKKRSINIDLISEMSDKPRKKNTTLKSIPSESLKEDIVEVQRSKLNDDFPAQDGEKGMREQDKKVKKVVKKKKKRDSMDDIFGF